MPAEQTVIDHQYGDPIINNLNAKNIYSSHQKITAVDVAKITLTPRQKTPRSTNQKNAAVFDRPRLLGAVLPRYFECVLRPVYPFEARHLPGVDEVFQPGPQKNSLPPRQSVVLVVVGVGVGVCAGHRQG